MPSAPYPLRVHRAAAAPSATSPVGETGYRVGVAAFTATIAYDVAQILQVVGVLHAPLDGILIYATSLCIVVPFVLEMLALHHLTSGEQRFWTHAAVVFTTIYAVFATANYVVQLATVIPATMRGTADPIRLLHQTPHSMYWDYDAVAYIAMGVATLFAAWSMSGAHGDRWARRALLANAMVTPLIAIVYFHPRFSTGLLFIGFPWAVTAPLSMLLLARRLRVRIG